jgi:hypothetical protein
MEGVGSLAWSSVHCRRESSRDAIKAAHWSMSGPPRQLVQALGGFKQRRGSSIPVGSTE